MSLDLSDMFSKQNLDIIKTWKRIEIKISEKIECKYRFNIYENVTITIDISSSDKKSIIFNFKLNDCLLEKLHIFLLVINVDKKQLSPLINDEILQYDKLSNCFILEMSIDCVEPFCDENRVVSVYFNINEPSLNAIKSNMFNQKNNDMGYLGLSKLSNKKSKIIVTSPKVTLPDGKQAVGIFNPGATCYMNSILQILFHIRAFRRFIYSINVVSDAQKVIYNLQSLFGFLQTSYYISTTDDLRDALGFSKKEEMEQKDVHEFFQLLLSKIENELSHVKDMDKIRELNDLFKGTLIRNIKCLNVDYHTQQKEEYIDISLPIDTDPPTLEKAFESFVLPYKFSGNNQYNTENFGKQDAHLYTEIEKSPPVLFIHLNRFQFSEKDMNYKKNNSFFEFPNHIDLEKYIKNQDDCLYTLFSVLIHTGSLDYGHYCSFIRLDGDKWYEFNDHHINETSYYFSVNNNFGGILPFSRIIVSNDSNVADNYTDVYKIYNAYMLVYVKNSEMPNIFQTVNDFQIPKSILNINPVYYVNNNDKISLFILSAETIRKLALNDILGIPNYSVIYESSKFEILKSATFKQVVDELYKLNKIEDDNNPQLHEIIDGEISRRPIKESSGVLPYKESSHKILLIINSPYQETMVRCYDMYLVIYFFNPKRKNPLSYLDTVGVLKSHSIANICVRATLRDPKADLLVYGGNSSQNELIPIPESVYIGSDIMKSISFLVYQYRDYDNQTNRDIFKIIEPSESLSDKTYNYLKDHYELYPKTVDRYMIYIKDSKTMIFTVPNNKIDQLKVIVPANLKYDSFISWLSQKLNVQNISILNSRTLVKLFFNNVNELSESEVYTAIGSNEEIGHEYVSGNVYISQKSMDIDFKQQFIFNKGVTYHDILNFLNIENDTIRVIEFDNDKKLKRDPFVINKNQAKLFYPTSNSNINIELFTKDDYNNCIQISLNPRHKDRNYDYLGKIPVIYPIDSNETFLSLKEKIKSDLKSSTKEMRTTPDFGVLKGGEDVTIGEDSPLINEGIELVVTVYYK